MGGSSLSPTKGGREGAPRARILLVEDDESIALGLMMNLQADGYDVVLATDGEQGLDLGLRGDMDLVILDVMLPKLNGFEVVTSLRERGQLAPVIMLSARGAEEDKVMGLELGAEDYITKPFSLAELLARVKATLRRETIVRHGLEQAVRMGEVEVNASTRQVWRRGELVELTVTEFDVLWCLVEAGGRVLSRDQILSKVWGPEHHGTLRTIDNFLLHLRNKLEEDPGQPRHLLTVRGVGYRFRP